MFEHFVYMPLLKSKQSEMLALKRLKKEHRDVLLPMIDLVAPSKNVDMANSKTFVANNISKLGGRLQEFSDILLDSSEIDAALRLNGGAHPLSAAAAALEQEGINVIPVVGTSRDAAHIKAVQEVLKSSGGGIICVRVDRYDVRTPTQSASQLKEFLATNFPKTGVILVYDLGDIFGDDPATLSKYLENFDKKIGKDSIELTVVCGSGIPENIRSAVPPKSAGYIDRVELQTFYDLRQQFEKNKREGKLIFGDYATLNSGYVELDWALVNRTITPKITYALKNSWFVIRGASFAKHPDGYKQYYSLASEVRKLPDVSSPSFCHGDTYIADRAKKKGTTDSPGSWTGVCVNHHLAVTVEIFAT